MTAAMMHLIRGGFYLTHTHTVYPYTSWVC